MFNLICFFFLLKGEIFCILSCSLNCFKSHKGIFLYCSFKKYSSKKEKLSDIIQEKCVNIENEIKREQSNAELKPDCSNRFEKTEPIQYKFPIQTPLTDDLNSVEADFIPKEKLKLLGKTNLVSCIFGLNFFLIYFILTYRRIRRIKGDFVQ